VLDSAKTAYRLSLPKTEKTGCIPGEMNDKNIIIEKGLIAKTAVWLRHLTIRINSTHSNNLITLVRDQKSKRERSVLKRY